MVLSPAREDSTARAALLEVHPVDAAVDLAHPQDGTARRSASTFGVRCRAPDPAAADDGLPLPDLGERDRLVVEPVRTSTARPDAERDRLLVDTAQDPTARPATERDRALADTAQDPPARPGTARTMCTALLGAFDTGRRVVAARRR